MKLLKFFFAFVLAFFINFNTNAQPTNTEFQAPVQAHISVDAMDFAVFPTGVDCYASGEFVIHTYRNCLDLYTSDGVLTSYKLKEIRFAEDSIGQVTKTYKTKSGVNFKVLIRNDGWFGLKTPYDKTYKDAYQYEFVGILKMKLTEESNLGFYFPFDSISKTEITTPWGIVKIPQKSE